MSVASSIVQRVTTLNLNDIQVEDNFVLGTGAFSDFGVYANNAVTAALSTGYIPYKSAGNLVNSIIYTDGTNIGINTNSPSAKFEIRNTVSTYPSIKFDTNQYGGEISTARNTGTYGILFLKPDGGEVRIIKNNTEEPYLTMYSVAGTGTIKIAANGITYFNGGNVGIGITNPSVKFEISGGATQTAGDLRVDTSGGGTIIVGRLDSTSGNNTTFKFADRVGTVKSRWNNAGSGSIYYGNFVSGYGVKILAGSADLNSTTNGLLEVDSSGYTGNTAVFVGGNVGINTISPAVKLTIKNNTGSEYAMVGSSSIWDIALGITANTSKITGMDFKNEDATGQVRLLARNDQNDYLVMNIPGSTSTATWFNIAAGNGAYIWLNGATDTDKALGIGTISNGSLILGTNNTKRLEISSSGDITFSNITSYTIPIAVTINTTGRALLITNTSILDSANASIYLGNTTYGFDLTYEGTGAGNLNAFVITASNGGVPNEAIRINQDGIVQMPKLGATIATNVILHAGNYDSYVYTEAEINNFFLGTTAIIGYNKNAWDEAWSWGNHAEAGYLMGELDTLNTVTTRGNTTSNDITIAKLVVKKIGTSGSADIILGNETTNTVNSSNLYFLEQVDLIWGTSAYGFRFHHDASTNILSLESSNLTTVGTIFNVLRDSRIVDFGYLPTVGGSNLALQSWVSTNYQPLDTELTALAGLTSAADKLPYFTGLGTASLTTFTSTARSLLDDTTTSDMRTTLGLAIGTNVLAYDAGLSNLASVVMAANQFYYTTADNTHAAATVTSFARSILDDADEATFKATVNLEIGVDVQAYSLTLANLVAAVGTGFLVKSGVNTWSIDTNTYSVSTHNHSGTYEPAITAGTTSQYWRGDKTWQTLDKASVGLNLVDNVSINSWTGSTNIVTIGTLSAGTVPWARLSNIPNYAASASSGGPASSVAGTLILKFDTGTTENTDLYTFNGSTNKTIDIKAGSNVAITKTANSISIASTYSYTLPLATSTAVGGVKLGSDTDQTVAANSVTATASRSYAIQLNASDQMVVNVPWVNTTYNQATTSALGLVKLGVAAVDQTVNSATTTAGRFYPVGASAGGVMYVNVPWVDTNTTYSGSTSVILNGSSFERAALTGDVTASQNSNATTIAAGAVTLAKMANLAANSIIGNNTGSAATPIALSATDVKTFLGVTTVGNNLLTLTNPSAITFIKINADNTVTTRSAANFKTDLSLNNVENTAISTWTGSSNIVTVGTLSSGTIPWSLISGAPSYASTAFNRIVINDTGTYTWATTNDANIDAGGTNGIFRIVPGSNISLRHDITNKALLITASHHAVTPGSNIAVDNSGATFIQDLTITLDAYGHVTTATTSSVAVTPALIGAASSSHTHGNITSAGAIGSTADLIVKTTTSGVLTTLAAGTSGQFLQYNGTWATPPDTNTTYTNGTGLTLTGTTFAIDILGTDSIIAVLGYTASNVVLADYIMYYDVTDTTVKKALISELPFAQAAFYSIAVSGQTTVTAASTAQAITFVAGTNMTITTDNAAKTITFTASGGGGSGDITAVTAGNGLTGGGITGDVTLTLGTPSTLTSSTTNAVTTSSHTHAITTGISSGNIVKISSTSNSAYIPIFSSTGIENSVISYAGSRFNYNNAHIIFSSGGLVQNWHFMVSLNGDAVLSNGTSGEKIPFNTIVSTYDDSNNRYSTANTYMQIGTRETWHLSTTVTIDSDDLVELAIVGSVSGVIASTGMNTNAGQNSPASLSLNFTHFFGTAENVWVEVAYTGGNCRVKELGAVRSARASIFTGHRKVVYH